MNQIHKVVIGGGGFAGLKLALELADNPSFDVTLVSDKPAFEYHAALYRSATGRSPLEVVLPINKLIQDASNVELVLDKLVSIDNQRKVAISETENEYKYDSLVLALGQTTNYYGIEGMEENSYSLDTVAQSVKLRRHLHDAVVGEEAEVNFVVVGAGASGTELSAELGKYIHRIANNHGIKEKNFKVTLIEGSDRVLPLLSKRVSAKAKKRLEKLGVQLYLNRRVEARTFEELVTDEQSFKTHTVVWTAGAKTNGFYDFSRTIFKRSKNGRVVVDEYLQASPDIYVIGDNADTKYSGMAQTALYDAKFIAHNLRRQVHGHQLVSYKAKRPIYVVPAGGNYALMQWGRLVIVGLPAWIMRRLADLRLFAYFEPFKDAVKTWRYGHKKAVEVCNICGHVKT